MKRTFAILVLTAAAGFPPVAAAQGSLPAYEPSQRQRTPLDTCGRSEVLQEAWCVKKCAADFRLEGMAPKARCVGTKQSAKVPEPPPAYKPAARDPNARPAPGG
jgi:hypothetical protein